MRSWKDRIRAKKTDVQKFDNSQRCFTAVSFKLLEKRVGLLEVRRLQKTDISSYQQKEQAHQSAGSYSQIHKLSSEKTPTDLARGTLSSRKYEKDRYPTCSIIVWAGIMINGRTRLHVVRMGL
ncbi:hypothetical protein TNCV_1212211 [Trichonephila clavipes]|nr:hypothetical protein TNCV_1212211 [Trichonephila clavipes]